MAHPRTARKKRGPVKRAREIPLDQVAVDNAAEACKITAERINEELPNITNTLDRNRLARKRDQAETRADDLEHVRIHLVAAGTVIPGLAPAEVAELKRLAEELDDQIVRERLVTVTLGVVTSILESAVKVKDTIEPRLA